MSLNQNDKNNKSQNSPIESYKKGQNSNIALVDINQNKQEGNHPSNSKALESLESADAVGAAVTCEEKNHRGQWNNHLEFVLSIIGYSIGFGNIWRFPYVCFDNGGGAFLIPYLIMLFLIGKPLYFMELALGQFTRQGPPGAFKIAPISMGIGYAMLFTCLIICIYYNVLMAYTLFYTFASFQKVLPWSHCNNQFNTKFCYDASGKSLALPPLMPLGSEKSVFVEQTSLNITNLSIPMQNISLISNITGILNSTLPNFDTRSLLPITPLLKNSTIPIIANVSSMEEFWKIKVLGFDRSTGIHDPINIKWDLALLLLLSWIIVFSMLYKGIHTAGKALYVTATLPYLLLIILLIRGVTLNGAIDGIKYLFTPQWHKLLDIKVWRAACAQMFFSLSLALGGIITLSSFNPFGNNCYKDTMIVSVMDTLTSLIAGTVIFSYLGNMAKELNISLTDGTQSISGPGLIFIVYPRAVSRLPLPQLWSILFFLMLYILGLDSEIALLQTVSSAIHDQMPTVFPWKYKTQLTLGLCVLCFLLGLPFITYGGFYVFDIINFYVGDFCLIIIAATELIAVMYIYGFKRFLKDIEVMLGKQLPHRIYWLSGWVFFGPVILTAIAVASLYDLVTQDSHKLDSYNYPRWAHGVGSTLTIAILAQIVVIGLVYVLKQPATNTWKKLKQSTHPADDFWLKGCNYKDMNFKTILEQKLNALP